MKYFANPIGITFWSDVAVFVAIIVVVLTFLDVGTLLTQGLCGRWHHVGSVEIFN